MAGKILPYEGIWTRTEVEADPENIYVFGDNLADAETGYVPSVTQAVIRGLPNAFGIITKIDRKLSQESFLNDINFGQYRFYLHNIIFILRNKLKAGKNVYIPMRDGQILLGTGKAKMPEKAPMCFELLCNAFKELFNEFGDKNE
jgi:hypothetical protein